LHIVLFFHSGPFVPFRHPTFALFPFNFLVVFWCGFSPIADHTSRPWELFEWNAQNRTPAVHDVCVGEILYNMHKSHGQLNELFFVFIYISYVNESQTNCYWATLSVSFFLWDLVSQDESQKRDSSQENTIFTEMRFSFNI